MKGEKSKKKRLERGRGSNSENKESGGQDVSQRIPHVVCERGASANLLHPSDPRCNYPRTEILERVSPNANPNVQRSWINFSK